MMNGAKGNVITRFSIGFVAAALLISGCKLKNETDEPLKVPEKKASADASSTPSATPDSSGASAASASATASAAPSASPATTETTTPGAGGNAGIDNCCAALNAVQSSGVGKDSKKKSAAAALACTGISKLVKSGRTSRGAALVQVKASLAGASLPAACN